jgi:hypothetical protein
VLPDHKPAAHQSRVRVRDHGGDGGRTMRRDVVGDRFQLRKGVAGHRLGENVDDAPAGKADGEGVVVADAVPL